MDTAVVTNPVVFFVYVMFFVVVYHARRIHTYMGETQECELAFGPMLSRQWPVRVTGAAQGRRPTRTARSQTWEGPRQFIGGRTEK